MQHLLVQECIIIVLKFYHIFSKFQKVIARTTGLLLDMFILIQMHFHAESKFGNKNLNFKQF